MSRNYSTDLRVRVIEAILDGLSTRKAAARKQGQPSGSKLDEVVPENRTGG